MAGKNSSVNACCLTHGSCIEVTGPTYSDYSDDVSKDGKHALSVHAIAHVLQSNRVLDQCAACIWLGLIHSSYMCLYFLL